MLAKNKNTIVLMPPKTASNSIRFLLEQSGFIFSKDPKIQNYPQIHLKLSEIVDLYNIDNLDDYKIIQITRNPYHRYVSSFFFQKKITPYHSNPNYKGYDLEEFSKHLFKCKNSENFIEFFYGDTSFVNEAINNGFGWGGSRLYDTQISWNDLNANVSYFKLEEVSKDVKILGRFLNLELKPLPKINSQDLSFDYMSLISEKTNEIILKLFDEDFKTLGYKK